MALNLQDAFGTARFGQQSLRQGTDLATSLAAGFVRRMAREDAEEERKRREQAGLLGLAGAGVGAGVSGGSMLGTTTGMEIGKAFAGQGSPENIVAAMKNEQLLGQKDRELDVKEKELVATGKAEEKKELLRKNTLTKEKNNATRKLQEKGYRVHGNISKPVQGDAEDLDRARKETARIRSANPDATPFVMPDGSISLATKDITADDVDALSRSDLIKQDLEIVQETSPGAKKAFVVDQNSPDGYMEVFVAEKRNKAGYTQKQKDTFEDTENALTKDSVIKENRSVMADLQFLREAIESGNPAMVGVSQSKIITGLGGETRVSDNDIKRAAGSQSYWAKGARFFKKFVSGSMTEGDAKNFLKFLDTMEENIIKSNNEYVGDMFDRKAKYTDISREQFTEVFGNDFLLGDVKQTKEEAKEQATTQLAEAEAWLKNNPDDPRAEGVRSTIKKLRISTRPSEPEPDNMQRLEEKSKAFDPEYSNMVRGLYGTIDMDEKIPGASYTPPMRLIKRPKGKR